MKRVASLLLFFMLSSVAIASETLVSLDTREGVKQKFLLATADNASVSVILFPGGKGALGLYDSPFGGVGVSRLKNNFLVRIRYLFHKHGFNVATVDAPSDRLGEEGMLYGFRDSKEHVQDIDYVISYLKEHLGSPVWLIGTSRGVESAANIALNTQVGIDGLVFTSSMTEENGGGVSLPEMTLADIKVPVFITHHKQDGCWKTTPEGAELIKSMLTGAKVVQLKMYEGGRQVINNPCKAKTYHGYLGIEQYVVDDIAEFIINQN